MPITNLYVLQKMKGNDKMDMVKLSKLLSLVLRHNPDRIGITLDEHGWADVNQLLNRLGSSATMEDLRAVVRDNNKQRFTFNDNETKIRANQGHSIEVDLQLKEVRPPDYLYHGTADKFIDNIKIVGIEKRNRQHVHLSTDASTAVDVGKRHGRAVIITIDTKAMYEDGCKFYKSKNGVWLTDKVDRKYFNNISVLI